MTARLSVASTALEACQLTVAAFGRPTVGTVRRSGTRRAAPAPARVSVLLPLHDRLRRVATTGAWQIFATVPLATGIAGRVFSSGRAEIVTAAPGGATPQPDISAQVCVPVVAPGGPVGVLMLEWATADTGRPLPQTAEWIDLPAWQATAERVAARLGARITQLGGPPQESRDEKLLRHAATLTAATDEPDLVTAVTDAARDVSGLGAAIPLLAHPTGLRLAEPGHDAGAPGALECRLRASLGGAVPYPTLERLMAQVHGCGATYALAQADADGPAEPEFPLPDGVGTLIAVPLGPADTGGLLLVADERVRRPDPTTMNLLELLAAQAWACLDRLRSLAGLRERAGSDPLTGLRHYGSFGERITETTPGRTALLAIDVDDFKIINDTYGHQAGDQVLVELARALELALRQGDELYRVGGDEFIAVIEVGRPEEAAGIAERLVTAARRIGRTISVGVAVQHDAESPELTLRRADAALYDVKRDGRDGIRLAAA